MKRVVVTGLGLITPLAVGVRDTWAKLLNCESGIERIISFEVDDLASKIAGQVPAENVTQRSSKLFDPTDYVAKKEVGRMDTFIIYAIAAATEAMEDAGLTHMSEEDKERSGVIIGSGIGGLPMIHDVSITLKENGPRRVSPFFIPSSLINLASGQVSIKYGLRGPNHAVVTACASGTHAIGDAYRMIKCSEADIMVAGGTEAAVSRLGVAGFSSARALSTKRNDTPHEASRPWDKGRDGFIISEGAGVLILEELEHAKARGAKIYGEVVGYGMSGDAYHITSPAPDGAGAYSAMRTALRMAEVDPRNIDYINAHGTSTPVGDLCELRAVERLLDGANTSMSSTKSSIGHLLGAAGAVEAAFTLLAIRDQVAPATLNLEDSEETTVDLVPGAPKERIINIAMSNSFGFGGTNASLVLKKFS